MEVLRHSIATTVVSCAVVIEGTSMLVEFTDGSLKQYGLQCRTNRPAQRESELRWKTAEQIVVWVGEHNRDAMSNARSVHHDAMVQRLGWDYQQRGYR